MSKGEGQKIAIEFTEVLRGDATGLLPSFGNEYRRPDGIATASSQYTTYAPSSAFDGSTSTQWYTRTTGIQWIQMDYRYGVSSSGFKWYVNSYRPKTFIVEASNDGITWSTLLEAVSADMAGWLEFQWEQSIPYSYYRWSILDRYSSYLYIYEIEMLVTIGNERAFLVTGEEHQYVGGQTINKVYKVANVERHPDFEDDKHLLLTMHPQGRFNNVKYSVSVVYNQALGTLRGTGGPVPGFSESFVPVDLETKPNPHVGEQITVGITCTETFSKVSYTSMYAQESIYTNVIASAILTYVGVVNP